MSYTSVSVDSSVMSSVNIPCLTAVVQVLSRICFLATFVSCAGKKKIGETKFHNFRCTCYLNKRGVIVQCSFFMKIKRLYYAAISRAIFMFYWGWWRGLYAGADYMRGNMVK